MAAQLNRERPPFVRPPFERVLEELRAAAREVCDVVFPEAWMRFMAQHAVEDALDDCLHRDCDMCDRRCDTLLISRNSGCRERRVYFLTSWLWEVLPVKDPGLPAWSRLKAAAERMLGGGA